MIHLGSRQANTPCAVRVAAIADAYDLNADFDDLRVEGIDVREFRWQTIGRTEAQNISDIMGWSNDLQFETYQVPSDGISDLLDTDFWLFASDHLRYPIIPAMPHAIIVDGYVRRYVPEIFPEVGDTVDLPFLQAVRDAGAVIATTPQTRSDVISYAGVPANRVHLAPMAFDPAWMKGIAVSDVAGTDYIVWSTNPKQHNNHLRALDALQIYYEQYNGKLDVRVVGANSFWFDPELELPTHVAGIPYVHAVRRKVSDADPLRQRLAFLGLVSDSSYARLLAGAAFLWHPALFDNGTLALAEAAWCGCPSLSSDYPQVRYISERYDLPTTFFDARSPIEMAQALKRMEGLTSTQRKMLPSRERLASLSWQSYAVEYWSVLSGLAQP